LITQIGHTAYRVKDIAASLDFYKKIGLTEAFTMEREGKLWIVYMRLNDSQFLELFPDATEPTTLGPLSIGYAHLCLNVNDIQTTTAEIVAAGIPLDRPISKGRDGNLQAWIVDPDGNRIELMQMMPDSLQAQSKA
jgi:lactoylglutathione lyase